MSSERVEWVEIIEPRSKEHMYANLTTGECVWDPPEGVSIKRTESSQWWELFDTNTQRFYYYNVASQSTVWHRPHNCDIIPLAKLQTLKQTTDIINDKEEISNEVKSNSNASSQFNLSEHHRQLAKYSQERCISSSKSDNKPGSTRVLDSYRMSIDRSVRCAASFKNCRHSHDSIIRHKDSGKSSDSSLSSIPGYRRGNEGGSLRIESSQRKKQLSDKSYQALQESSSSYNIPYNNSSERQKLCNPRSKLTYSVSNSTDLGRVSPTNSAHMTLYEDGKSCARAITLSDFDKHSDRYKGIESKSVNGTSILSLTRSGSFISPTKGKNEMIYSARGMYMVDNHEGAGSDDSMHEKYFKSVENTPLTRRRHTLSSKAGQKNNSSDSSQHSPTSPQRNSKSFARPTALNNINSFEPPSLAYLKISATKNKDSESTKLDQSQPESNKSHTSMMAATFESSEDVQNMVVPKSNLSKLSPSGNNKIKKEGLSASYIPKDLNSSWQQTTFSNQQVNATKPKIEYKNDLRQDSHRRDRKRGKQCSYSSEVEYDNGNTSPLYSNWDQEMQEHLLPLQHYIMEQAKLSACTSLEDPLDSDSYHSDSQSEHSLSGHEPDNEDSDHSDHCDYLSHNLLQDYESAADDGVSYYGYQLGAFNNLAREDISDEVEAILEGERNNTKIYSSVQGHGVYYFGAEAYRKSDSHQKGQSQTLPSPNRQVPKIDCLKDSSTLLKFDVKEESSSAINQSVISNKMEKYKTPNASPIFNVQLGCMKECDIEKFAQDNLNLHSKGIFRKKSSVRDMLSFTAEAISRPMLALARDKSGKKMATDLFKLVQIYMGDRKARIGMSLNSVAIDIIVMALSQQQLQDELYVHLCRQTTENPKRESLIRGWELLAICLSFVPPSPTFQPALLNYVNRHRDPTFATSFPELRKWPIHVQISHYASVCCRRLDRIGSTGKKQAKKPSEDEVEQSRNQILRDSMFGNTLKEVMQLQRDKFPGNKLPWIQITLSQQILNLNGKQTEGIFRVSADVDEVNGLKNLLDRWEVPDEKTLTDAHAPASLLKLWYRELYDPLIPDDFYDECVQTEDPIKANDIINKLPELNKIVLMYLVHFLQQFTHPDVVSATKMDFSNLAMVFAPNCLRCTSDDPKVILENARKEMAFMRTLIQHMDTSSVSKMI